MATDQGENLVPGTLSAAAKPRPFRPFYFLAASDAVLGVVLTTPLVATMGFAHQSLLLFGTVPAILAGFLLTALPRWTGCPPLWSATIIGFVSIWLAMRITFFAVGISAANVISALFILALAFMVGLRVIAARNTRNYSVVVLLLIFATTPLVSLILMWPAIQLAVATIVCLMIIIAGRVIPALSAAGLGEEGANAPMWREQATGAAAVIALSFWVLLPEHTMTAYFCLLAALAQLFRLVAWCGWRTVSVPSALFLHLAYVWIPVGFGLLSLHILFPAAIGVTAAIHAWLTGAFGSLAIAIMGSMIRRHDGRPFEVPLPEYGAYLLVTAAAIARLMVEVSESDSGLLMNMASVAWIGAFCAFLLANWRTPVAKPASNDG